MNTRQGRSFSGFLAAFIGIIVVAFGVLVWAGAQNANPKPVDNVALPH